MNENVNQRICPKCGEKNPDVNRVCKSCGERLVPVTTRSPVKEDKPYNDQSKWVTPFIVIIIAFVLYVLFWPMGFHRARHRTPFTACLSELMTISTGMQTHISETGSLNGVGSEDDICHHLIPGAESPKDCVGEVKERINNVCVSGTLKVRVLDNERYEIKAKAKDENNTTICVTEAGIAPEEYGDEFEGCKH